MKKVLLLLLLFVFTLVLSACAEKKEYTVIFDSYGGTEVVDATVTEGDSLNKPTDPDKEGYTFIGWFIDSEYTSMYNFTSEVKEEILLYAKWEVGIVEIDCDIYPVHTDCDEDIVITDQPNIINVLDELPSENIVIELWHFYGGSKGDLLERYIDEFEALYPNITINDMNQGLPDNVHIRVPLAIPVGNAPTMVIGYSHHVSDYLSLDLVIPLDDFIYDSTFGIDLTDFVDDFVDESRQHSDGYMYSLPFSKVTEVLVVNSSKFEANGLTVKTDSPYTWAELEVLADTLVGDGDNQCEYLINYDVTSNLFTNSLYQFGGEYTNSSGDLLFNNATTLSMMEYFSDRFTDKTLSIPLIWEHQSGNLNFIAEDVCMTVTSVPGLPYNVPMNNEFDVEIAFMPQYDSDNQAVFYNGPDISILEDTTDAERLAAWMFMKYITNTENTTEWSISSGFMPVRYSAFQTTEYQNLLTNPSVDDTYKSAGANISYLQIDNLRYTPGFVVNMSSPLSSATSRVQAEYAMQQILSGSYTFQEIIDNMLSEMNRN